MPWLSEAKKAGKSGDKPPRGAKTRSEARIAEWGGPAGVGAGHQADAWGETGELKQLSTRRKRK